MSDDAPMTYRRLGDTGLKVSAVSLGSWLTFGSSVADETTAKCVAVARDHGINFFDTADIYARGDAELALGKAIAGIRRQDLVIASKCFWPMTDDPNDRGLSRKHIIESCEGSLRRLGLDYLDLYQCHRYDDDTPVREVVRAMDDLVRQGKILYWGVSCWTAGQIREACEVADATHAVRPASNQPPYNLLERDIEAEVIPESERWGLGQIVFSPLAQGVLTGKYSGGKRPAGSRAADEQRNKFIGRYMDAATLAKVDAFVGIAKELDVTPAQLALAWCLRRDGVASVIIGATKVEQVVDNAGAVSVTLDAEVAARVEKALA